MTAEVNGIRWFGVRCVFMLGWPPDTGASHYEERVTLWRAASFDEAIARAEAEATDYAAAIDDRPSEYLGIAQAFALFEDPDDGAEVFSLIRVSALDSADYVARFFATGDELSQ